MSALIGGPCPNPDHCRHWKRYAVGPWTCEHNHPRLPEPLAVIRTPEQPSAHPSHNTTSEEALTQSTQRPGHMSDIFVPSDATDEDPRPGFCASEQTSGFEADGEARR